MLSVFVCEDDPLYRRKISEFIQNYISIEELDIEFTLCTSDPTKIVRHIKANKVTGLYFLDVELECGYNGVGLAKTIRQHDPRGFIVFVTAHPRYMSLTFEYKIEALAYIRKEEPGVVMQKITDCIRDAYNKHVSRSYDGCFIFKTISDRKVSCLYSDILFFGTDAPGTKRIIAHTKKRQYVFYGSLDEILSSLPFGLFYKCHKSYVVNVGQLTEKNKHEIIQGKDCFVMTNGSACAVSARKRSGLIKLIESNFAVRKVAKQA
jgi:two-component system response regulator AgrA